MTVKSLKTEEVSKVDEVHGFCVYFFFTISAHAQSQTFL